MGLYKGLAASVAVALVRLRELITQDARSEQVRRGPAQ